MNNTFLTIGILGFFVSIFLSSGANAQTEIPPTLRQGIKVDAQTVETAVEMQNQGWTYMMPIPKRPQARWGNTDGRTTWYIGYWINKNTDQTSLSLPKKIDGEYKGDNQGGPAWRRGGTPRRPTKLEWLLSTHGGIRPSDT